MQRYDTYKPSGVKWLGEIPSHWEVKRLKNVVSYNDDVLLETEKKDKQIKYVEISDVDSVSGIKQYSEYDFKDAPSRARRITRKGDVIVSTVRTYLRAVAQINDDDLIVSTGFAVLRAKKIDKRFLAYYILSDSFISEVIRRSVGTSYPAINANELVSIYLICPPNNEQTAIANYLDTATAKIDAAIAQQQKMIGLLNERKQIIINRAVTRGLNSNARMKDSGVEWIGEVPEHWEVRRLGSLGEFSKGGNISRDDLQEYGKCAILYGDIYTKYNIQTSIAKNHISEKTAKRSVRITKGDVLMTGSGETKEDIGKTIVYLGDEAFIGGDVILFRQQNNDSTFLSYALNSQYAKDYRYKESKGEIIVHIYASSLKRLFLALPPIEEQIKVVKYLDGQIDSIDSEIEVINKQISLLQERKQIVINEVVTGKVKVE